MKPNLLQQATGYITEYRGRKRWQKVVTCLAAIVVFCTTYALILPAITLEEAYCGMEEHTHSDSCYTEVVTQEAKVHEHGDECYTIERGELICTLEEGDEHHHDDSCYEEVKTLTCTLPEIIEPEKTERKLTCKLEEHTHCSDCYSDLSADVETSEIWKSTFSDVKLTGEWKVDVLNIARTQLGYEESYKNYNETASGERNGYTRYGAWYGNSYGDWCAMFVSFCLNYAEVDGIPFDAGCQTWIARLSQEEYDLYRTVDKHNPAPGELIFFDWDEDGSADHVGLVEEIIPKTKNDPAKLVTIEGNSSDRVQRLTYEQEDSRILGYGMLPKQKFYCELTGHVHNDDCKDSNGDYVCGLKKHIHTNACEIKPEDLAGESEESGDSKASQKELTYYGPDYSVLVRYGSDANLPEDVTLKVSEILPDTMEYESYYNQSVEAMGFEDGVDKVVLARFFDIQFRSNGEKLEPAAPVSVTITYDQAVKGEEHLNCQSVHFTDKGLELLDVKVNNPNEKTTSFTHEQDSFSVVGNVATVSANYNSTDVGPEKLKVDYYVCIDGTWTLAGSTRTGWYGDYTAKGWTDYNRDYITVAQAESILGKYGFNASADNPARKIAYQQKSIDTKIYSDTNTVDIDGNSIIPLARNSEHAGYNLYYLPANTDAFAGKTSADNDLDKANNGFYTVSVYDPNHLAYGEDETLPESQLIRAGGSCTVTVKGLPDQSSASWKCVGQDWQVVSEGTVNSDGTITYNLTGINQQLRITPITNELGTSYPQVVHYLVYLDGKWTEAGSTTTIYKQDSHSRYFVTAAQVESVLGPYGFSGDTYSFESGKGNSLAHQLDTANLQGTFYTDNDSWKLADNSWAIGLSYNVTEYYLYYLPENTESFDNKTPEGFAASSDMDGNRFWTVKVRDDGRNIYNSAQLESMTRYVRDTDQITVTVENADGIIWSCVGVNGQDVNVDVTQSAGKTSFTISNVTQPVEIEATKANPSFTVQYYGNIPRFATSGDNPLKVIDTSGKALPTNGGTMATRNLYLEGTGQNTNQNAGNATELYRVKTTTELVKLYSEKTFQYESSPDLYYFNKLKDNESYDLKEIWVLKEGKNESSTNRADWDIYTYVDSAAGGTAFTNESGQAKGNTILIRDGDVIRLVTDSSTGSYHNGTSFYDYNISSGQNADGRWRTGITGINTEENYETSANGQRNWRSGADILAFGNANCGTGMSGYLFDGSTLNKFSSKNSGYGGATFGLAQGLNSDGTIKYNDWIVAPKLFNEGEANGKQTYDGSSLAFERVGDTYTLSSATLKNSNGQSNTLSNLQYFFNPSPTSATTHTHIFTNNFWPMDQAAGRTDALWGQYGNPGSFQGYTETNDYKWSNLASNFPPSDDGNAHNWFFGMNFALSFNLTADYEGPLEYYFFGDDDLWVFLDGRLICDIGGVHSSIGEFVNLRDYLPVGSSGQHTLSFFYTERGASGSTCYMSFTLPSVSGATTSRDTGSLEIAKTLGDTNGADLSQEEYEFRVDFLTDENGSAVNQTFSYKRTNDEGEYFGTVRSGGKIKMKANEKILVSGIPAGTYYRVTELTTEGYRITANDERGYIVSGKIQTGEVKPASFVNTPYYELPETGGPGTIWYTLGGLLLIAASGFFLLYRYYKRGKEEF
ncbi:MAG: fibro-slime domain-containing protein [Eubacteriaceae bacterium]|nr:fibro-slime domain-containing protein [Eubacteriaceae bacterium]